MDYNFTKNARNKVFDFFDRDNINGLSYDEMFNFAENVIKKNRITPYLQLKRYIDQHMVVNDKLSNNNAVSDLETKAFEANSVSDSKENLSAEAEYEKPEDFGYDDFRKSIEKACENNMLRWIQINQNDKVLEDKENKDLQYDDLRLFVNGERGSLPSIIDSLCKCNEYFYNSAMQQAYLDRYNNFLIRLNNYKAEYKSWKSGGRIGKEPTRPTKPEAGRRISRYQLLFVCFALNCNIDEAEMLLNKVLNQRGFNFKNPLDLMCYWGLKHKTNKYGEFIKIRNAFYKADINKKSAALERNTNIIRKNAEERIAELDLENTTTEKALSFIIESIVLSDDIYDKVKSGKDIIDYYFGNKDLKIRPHLKNPDCLTYSSVSARKELFYLLGLNDLLNERAHIKEQINDLYILLKNRRRIQKEQIKNSYNYNKIELECNEYSKKIMSLFQVDENLSEDKVLVEIDSVFSETEIIDDFIEKTELIASDLYYLPLYQLNAHGMFDETVLNKSTIEKLVTGEKSVNREILILAYLYYFCRTESFQIRSSSDKDLINEFIQGINTSLNRAGYNDFYPVNPYEAVILLTLYTIDPIETLSEIIYRDNIKNHTYGDED